MEVERAPRSPYDQLQDPPKTLHPERASSRKQVTAGLRISEEYQGFGSPSHLFLFPPHPTKQPFFSFPFLSPSCLTHSFSFSPTHSCLFHPLCLPIRSLVSLSLLSCHHSPHHFFLSFFWFLAPGRILKLWSSSTSLCSASLSPVS